MAIAKSVDVLDKSYSNINLLLYLFRHVLLLM